MRSGEKEMKNENWERIRHFFKRKPEFDNEDYSNRWETKEEIKGGEKYKYFVYYDSQGQAFAALPQELPKEEGLDVGAGIILQGIFKHTRDR